jgi:hypothetical protein
MVLAQHFLAEETDAETKQGIMAKPNTLGS